MVNNGISRLTWYSTSTVYLIKAHVAVPQFIYKKNPPCALIFNACAVCNYVFYPVSLFKYLVGYTLCAYLRLCFYLVFVSTEEVIKVLLLTKILYLYNQTNHLFLPLV